MNGLLHNRAKINLYKLSICLRWKHRILKSLHRLIIHNELIFSYLFRSLEIDFYLSTLLSTTLKYHLKSMQTLN